MGQPGMDSSSPLVQIEAWELFLVDSFQGDQDFPYLLACVTSNATERVYPASYDEQSYPVLYLLIRCLERKLSFIVPVIPFANSNKNRRTPCPL